MKSGWRNVPLSKVLKQDTNYVFELEPKTYSKLSVRLYGKGVTLDAPTDGATVKMQRHQFAKPGQVILSEIWAKKGAIGIVPNEGKNALVTSHFFLFDIDETILYPEYIFWLLKGNYFAEKLNTQARGTTGYAAIRPKQFLSLEIPLPPLDEQRRIVARIEALAERVIEAQRLRQEAVEEGELLLTKIIIKIFSNLKGNNDTLGNAVDKKTGVAYKSSDFSDNIDDGVPVIRLTEIRTKKPLKFLRNPDEYPNVWLREGDIILAKTSWATGSICIWNEGKAVLNQNAVMFRVKPGLDKDYLYFWLNYAISSLLNKQLADPNYYPYIREKDLLNWHIPIPPIEEQFRIVNYLNNLQVRINSLHQLQSITLKELDALLQSILDKAFKGEL
jgi:type I restriction enzyme S subunit